MSNPSELKNIVWVSMESVRADHTTPAGYDRDTTPNLSRIANLPEGDWFGQCFSNTRWTPASTASMLSGTYLGTHTVGIHSPTVNKLPPSIDTMPSILGELGYDTLGIGNNAFISQSTELNRGFDQFINPGPRNLLQSVGIGPVLNYLRNIGTYGPGLTLDTNLHKATSLITDATKKWIEQRVCGSNPFFVYIHFNDTHYPYTPPEPFVSRFTEEIGLSPDDALEHSSEIYSDLFQLVADGLPLSEEQWDAIEAAYDGDIAYVDHFIGELFNYIQTAAVGDTVFIVTSDHAELFGERGWLGHHVVPATEMFHVPLIVHGLPEISHQTDEFVQHVDLTRTVIESVGGTADQFEGVNLAHESRAYAVGQSSPSQKDKEKLLERNGDFDVSQYRFDPINCIWDDEFKLVVGENGEQLFKRPDETTNVIDDYPDVAASLRHAVAELLPGLPETDRRDPADFNEDTYDKLRDMGYIQ